MLPEAIAREVTMRSVTLTDPPHQLPELGGQCEGSLYHSPRPLVTYEVWLPDNSGQVRLCGVCRDNLALLDRLQGVPGLDEPLPWDAMREFGNTIRRLGRTT